MPTDRRAVVLGLLAVFATKPTLKQAVTHLRALLADPHTGRTHTRPDASRGISSWLGQKAADLHGSDTSFILATVRDIEQHLSEASMLSHPLDHMASSLPPDVKAAAEWLISHHNPSPHAPVPAPVAPAPSPRPLDPLRSGAP